MIFSENNAFAAKKQLSVKYNWFKQSLLIFYSFPSENWAIAYYDIVSFTNPYNIGIALL